MRNLASPCVTIAIVSCWLAPLLGQIVNTGVPIAPSSIPTPAGNRWVAVVKEAGTLDRNGDGDLLDDVWVAFDTTTFAVIATGPATSPSTGFVTSQGMIYSAASESAQGNTDLNGDGDALDLVPCRWNATTGATTFPSAVASWIDVAPDDSRALVGLRESALGDLNGDGDTLDIVLHDWNPAGGPFVNRSVAVQSAKILPGGDIVAVVPEAANSSDLNGDGDSFDSLIRHFDAAASSWSNAANTGFIDAVDGSFAAIREFENTSGIDLNGDGDQLDSIVGVWNGATMTLARSGLDGQDVTASAGRVYFVANESKSGATDLNGDGDTLDRVLTILDSATAVSTFVPEAKGIGTQVPYSVSGDRIAYPTSEPWLASVGQPADKNGDGDALDFVMTVRDLVALVVDSGHAFNGGAGFRLSGSYVGYNVSEAADGQTDRDGDGTKNGFVFGVERFQGAWRSAFLDTAMSDPYPVPGGTGGEGRFLVSFDESKVAFDFNGDGLLNDFATFDFDLAAGTARSFGVSSVNYNSSTTLVALDVSELGEGADLNGDGDLLDDVIHFTPTAPGQSGAVSNYGTGCPTSAGKLAKVDLHGELAASGRFALEVSGAASGSTALVVLGTAQASIPTGLGCPLLTAPILPAMIGPLPMNVNGALGHSATVIGTMPASAPSGAGAFLQAFVADPVLGFVPSDAVAFTIG